MNEFKDRTNHRHYTKFHGGDSMEWGIMKWAILITCREGIAHKNYSAGIARSTMPTLERRHSGRLLAEIHPNQARWIPD